MNLVIADRSGEYPTQVNREYPVVVIFKRDGKVHVQRWFLWRAGVQETWSIISRHRELRTQAKYEFANFGSRRRAADWLQDHAHKYL